MKWLICRLFGHRKGKRVGNTETIECPRCRSTWSRPLPKPKGSQV